MFPGGYCGKILRINLTSRSSEQEELEEGDLKKFLGGRGMAALFYYREISRQVDPLSAENKIFFMTGPLTGAPVHSGTKIGGATKSPETLQYLCTNSGGRFGPNLKFAGYDGLVIEGRSEEPLFLSIEDGKVTFHKAAKIWGWETSPALDKMKEVLKNRKSAGMVLGPAGEKGVRFSCIQVDGRSMGRGGAGAVMASKNLKGILVCGSGQVGVADPEGLKRVIKGGLQKLKESRKNHTLYGTGQYTEMMNELGCYPTRNFQTAVFKGIETISSAYVSEHYRVKNLACFRCPVGCSQVCEVKEGPFRGSRSDPEYETIGAFGGQCGVSDFGAIIKANQLCDELGLDTMSCGTIIAFAMECNERGLFRKGETEGLDLRFGNGEAMVEMVKKIARREGLGDLLADGFLGIVRSRPDLSDYMMHVKGLPLASYDPRSFFGNALTYGTSSRGACHNVGGWTIRDELLAVKLDRFSTQGKGKLVKDIQDVRGYVDSLGICTVVRSSMGFNDQPNGRVLEMVTGEEFTPHLMEIGERVYNLERLILAREGKTRRDDYLPRRLTEEEIPEGMAKGKRMSPEIYNEMLDEYYRERGWDGNGLPKPETLERLALNPPSMTRPEPGGLRHASGRLEPADKGTDRPKGIR